MRNVFDQYSQPENRLTHALLASLDADRALLKRFIKWVGAGKPAGRPVVLQQSLPGELARRVEEDDPQRQGLPDGWIHDSQTWALLIENKVAARPSYEQIGRHLRTARARGFERPNLLWLTVTPVGDKLPPRVINRTWEELYAWLVRNYKRSTWARRAAQYFEVAEVEADMKSHIKKGTLTRFTGISFDESNPYSYAQAKRLLGLLRDELLARGDLVRKLKMNRNCPGRKAITGKDSTQVWDFISMRAARSGKVFTQNSHLTLGITDERIDAYITVPNGIRSRLRTALLGKDYRDFHAVMAATTRSLDKVSRRYRGSRPLITLVQRRYLSQRSPAIHDAVIRFDPRTAVPVSVLAGQRPVLRQPQWLIATDDALRHRRANLQLQVGAEFPYDSSRVTGSTKIVDAIAEVWLACTPIVQAMSERKKVRRKATRRRNRRRR